MTPDFGGFMDGIFAMSAIIMAISLLIPVAIIVLIVWAIRRNVATRLDPAELELRERLARGEIDMAEYQVRLRALRSPDGG